MKIFTFCMALVLIAGMASAQSYRLVAESEYTGTGAHFIPQDSTAYYYKNPLVSNTYSEADYYTYSGGSYDSDEVYYQSFYANKLVDTLFALSWSSNDARYTNNYIVLNFYDASNNDTCQIQQNWDSAAQQYINIYKQTYAYDANGNVTLNTDYIYNSVWGPAFQNGYTFNSHNKTTSQTYAVWEVSKWDTSQGYYDRTLFNYNSKGEDTLGINLIYNYTTLSWDTSNRLLLTFDKNRTLDSIEVMQSWHSNLPTWQNANEHILYYDANGNDTANYYNLPNGNQWENTGQTLSTYNANNYLTSEKLRIWNDSGYYEARPGAYEQFWYYGAYAGINPLAANNAQVLVYPNPASGEISVNISPSVAELNDWSLQITDALGRRVYTKSSLNYNNAIDVSNLASGMYFISVIGTTGKTVIPVVKQ